MNGWLDDINASMKRQGLKGRVVEHQGALVWRGTCADASGVRKSRRVALDLPANVRSAGAAEDRAVQLAKKIVSLGKLPDPLPWFLPIQDNVGNKEGNQGASHFNRHVPHIYSVRDVTKLLVDDFWKGKIKTSAAQRTLDRLLLEPSRMPEAATFDIDLVVAVASKLEPGSRTYQEFLKVGKRMARLIKLDGLERIDEIRTPYEPGERELPGDKRVAELLVDMDHGHKYAWMTWALATYGCRPAEVFSLKPRGDGTADVLTIKRKGKLPTWRTALALPVGPELELSRSVVWDIKTPQQYDSLEAKRLTQSWGCWLKRVAGGMQLYELRHQWAVRSIRKNLNASLAAKCMGHSLDVHHRTYHRWLEQSDVAAVAAQLARQ